MLSQLVPEGKYQASKVQTAIDAIPALTEELAHWLAVTVAACSAKIRALTAGLHDDARQEVGCHRRFEAASTAITRVSKLQAVVFKQMLAHEQFKGLSGVAVEVPSLISRLRTFIEVVRSSVDAMMNADPDMDRDKVTEILEAVDALEQTFTDKNSEIIRHFPPTISQLFPEEDPNAEKRHVNPEKKKVDIVLSSSQRLLHEASS